MCNPRRIQITATRQVHQAWEREVERVAEVAGTLTGEARISQALDATLGGSALMALQNALAQGFPGWAEQEDGSYRHPVEGGYAVYRPDSHSLEIVATLSEELRAQAAVRERLSGEFAGTVEAQVERGYYDDGYGGHTEQRARQEAQQAAPAALDQALRAHLAAAADAAETTQDAELRRRAQQQAQHDWERQADQRRDALSRRAAAELQQVGLRARLAFHQLLAHAYREALLGLARRRGADGIQCRDTDGYLEIEFLLPD